MMHLNPNGPAGFPRGVAAVAPTLARASSRLLRQAWVCLLGAVLVWAGAWLGAAPAQAQTFLPADQAFRLDVVPSGPRALQARFRLAPAVYLYREQMQASLQPAGSAAQALGMDLPPGKVKFDPTFDKELEVYPADVVGGIGLPAGLQGEAVLSVRYQGCADAGLCYPPQTRQYKLVLNAQGQLQEVLPLAPPTSGLGQALGQGLGRTGLGAGAAEGGDAAEASGAADPIRAALASGRWLSVVGVFFVAGVLLSLTPCVLPMVPILSSIIVGQQAQGAPVGRARGFALALAYAQGMALVYTALGVAAGLLGQGLAAWLQHPWVVLGFAGLMVLLALSMFGVYTLQLPASVQACLGAGSQKLPGGRFVSVFAMGVVSALIVSPCVSAPLAGALLYISQSRDVVLGGSALYAMAWGMSLPLLLVGLSAGSLLPRAGAWMQVIKVFFGLVLLAMAAYVARPAWPYVKTQVLGWQAEGPAHRSVLPFERVSNVAELDAALARARSEGRPVMLDFYADWCVACIEMERETFAAPAVQERLQGALLLQADVTRNSAEDRALMARFGLFGPPAIVFYDATGSERSAQRVIGFQNATDFQRSLSNAGL